MAATKITVNLRGMDECLTRLKNLSQEMAAKNLVSAAYTAMLPMERAIEDQISANGSIRTGTLQKSIARKKMIFPKTESTCILVGIDKRVQGNDKRGRRVWPVKYAHLVEKRKPFFRPAYNANAESVLQRYIAQLQKKLDKAGV